MERGKNIFYILSIAAIIFITVYYDIYLVQKVSFLRGNFLDSFFLIITFLSSKIILISILTAILLWKEHKRRWILPLWISFSVSAVVGFILKITVQRLRPFQQGIVSLIPSLQEASQSLWDFSFPSGHSLLAFCAIPILSETFPKFKKVWITFAILIAFSRVYFGLHFFSDVIVGGLIGYLIGLFIVQQEKDKGFGKKLYHKIMRR